MKKNEKQAKEEKVPPQRQLAPIVATSYDVQQKRDETLAAIKKDHRATDALRSIATGGIEQDVILDLLYDYCGQFPLVKSRSDKVDVGLHEHQQFNSRVKELITRLKDLADELDLVLEAMHQFRSDIIHFSPAKGMRKMADLLEITGDGNQRPGASARNEPLALLAEMIKIKTNEYHYEDLAELVNAVTGDGARPAPATSASVRGSVRRYNSDRIRHAILIDNAKERLKEMAPHCSGQS